MAYTKLRKDPKPAKTSQNEQKSLNTRQNQPKRDLKRVKTTQNNPKQPKTS